ncbi:carboxypeptidase-like regulatory domain-containing protein [Fodinisporobacter ferrooxydans]|uniref:Carboxypeptidase-like regulatory domain-containing protein n=1 Tax=Fodinisporobacter ferrooxydans TaxID=2901836 RepID=A0ABY4CLU4_9BACL|nr:carboxypeptidase-like regulatory domain-containing protein [Alicyclobacillaceae bacterium MYW30-H2]
MRNTIKKRFKKRIFAGTCLTLGLLALANPSFAEVSPASSTVNTAPQAVPNPKVQPQQQPKQVQPPQNQVTPPPAQQGNPNAAKFEKTAKLKVTVIDGRTRQPLPNAEIVLTETEQRFKTDAKGETNWIDAPIIRDERFRPMVAQLHGQLTLIAYKNGYRDTIYFNVRVHDGVESRVTMWMYQIAPGEDRRIEPLAYETPYHHLWLVQLADKFRSSTQPGEGPERP